MLLIFQCEMTDIKVWLNTTWKICFLLTSRSLWKKKNGQRKEGRFGWRIQLRNKFGLIKDFRAATGAKWPLTPQPQACMCIHVCVCICLRPLSPPVSPTRKLRCPLPCAIYIKNIYYLNCNIHHGLACGTKKNSKEKRIDWSKMSCSHAPRRLEGPNLEIRKRNKNYEHTFWKSECLFGSSV